MNGLNNLRRTSSKMDNRLLDYWQRHKTALPEMIPESETPPVNDVVAPVLPDATTVVAPVLSKPITGNAILNATASTPIPETKKTANSLLDYWGQPVIGKMPLDKFIQIAGALSSSIAPGEAVGRIGNVLSQIGGQAYKERIEEPENVLRRRLLGAQITEAETPKEWGAFYKEHMNTINPKTGKTFTVGETLKAFHETKEPQYNIDVQQDPTGKWQHGRRNKSTGVFTADRPATEAEITSKVTGVSKEPYHYVVDDKGNVSTFMGSKLISGSGKGTTKTEPKEGEHYEVNDQGEVSFYKSGKLISGPGKGKTKVPSASEKLTMADVKSAYSMDIGNIKNQMMIEMTPDEQANLAGQPTENMLTLLLAGRVGKSLSPEKKKYYIGKLQEAETYYSGLTDQVLGRKGAKIPQKVIPETEIEGGTISSRGKVILGPSKKVTPPEKEAPKGNTIQDVIKAGGKAVKMPDGSTHVFDKDGNYVGTAK